MKWLTPVVLFLLYLNVPAVAVRIHGAPFVLGVAAAFCSFWHLLRMRVDLERRSALALQKSIDFER